MSALETIACCTPFMTIAGSLTSSPSDTDVTPIARDGVSNFRLHAPAGFIEEVTPGPAEVAA